jgi:hypothetical protein
MKRKVCGAVIAVAVMLGAVAAGAHHSFSAEFDGNKPVKLTGIATSGEVVNWGAEMGPPHGLQRRGWRRDTLKIGEQVTVEGSLAKNGSKRLNARTVALTSTGARPGEVLDAVSSGGADSGTP